MIGRIAIATALAAGSLAAPAGATTRFAAPLPVGSTSDPSCTPTPCELRRAIVDVGQEGDEVVLAPGVYDPTTFTQALITIKAGMDVHGELGAPRPLVTRATNADNVFVVANGARLHHVVVRSDSDFSRPVHPIGDSVVVEDAFLLATGAHGAAAQVANEGVLRDVVAYAPGANGKGIEFGSTGTGTADVRNVTALAPGAQGTAIAGQSNSSGACSGSVVLGTLRAENTIAVGGATDIALKPDSTCPDKYPLAVQIGFSNYRTTSLQAFGTVTATGPNA